LLTNWIWWRGYIRDNRVSTIASQVHKNTEELCEDLERNFSGFKAFAEGSRDFFGAMPDPIFLSFPEFVEETELFVEAATLTLRLEDCGTDPLKEFSKIVDVMSVSLDLRHLQVVPPRAKPYGYLAVKERVPRFGDFISSLDPLTKERIEKIGYPVIE